MYHFFSVMTKLFIHGVGMFTKYDYEYDIKVDGKMRPVIQPLHKFPYAQK